ncbi:unnamed protein product [Phytophthora fragariaefolia]|uniref:Unnamed protein product n=1 Tax=Phytophthora fragariaefolia TaxID=1490495 RepID=A0A9W7CRK8_9STRA|nr:unnamed protein product [Phytophthora fragariaefolia]
MFIRPKIGIDTSTQIEESDGLFNFDVEVKPLLNVLVNKTLAQALVEVKEEQEMQMVHRQHEVLKAEKFDARQAERDLEEKAKEANRRKELIKKKKAEKQVRDQIMRRKLFAWQFARPLVSQAIDQATATLEKKGVFYDPMLRNLATWLSNDVYQAADDTIRLRSLSVDLLDGILFSYAADFIGHYVLMLVCLLTLLQISYSMDYVGKLCSHNYFQMKARLWSGYSFGILSCFLFQRMPQRERSPLQSAS